MGPFIGQDTGQGRCVERLHTAKIQAFRGPGSHPRPLPTLPPSEGRAPVLSRAAGTHRGRRTLRTGREPSEEGPLSCTVGDGTPWMSLP